MKEKRSLSVFREMLCSGRVLALLHPVNRLSTCKLQHSSSRFNDVRPILITKWRSMASDPDSSSFAPSIDSDKNPAGFCIIEGPDTVQDFANMDLQEIQDNIGNRRNKVFLHMEEVRRLRIQQRIKNSEVGILEEEQENELPYFPSFIPFLPPLSAANLKQYYATCFSLIAGIIIFGGLLAPTSG